MSEVAIARDVLELRPVSPTRIGFSVAPNATWLDRRLGFSLFELIAVLTVTSLIAVIATSLLFAMLQQNSAMNRQLLIGNSQQRLATRFRGDVQAATHFELQAAAISLVGPEGKVAYQHMPPGTVRRTTESNGQRRHDDFDMASHHVVAFSQDVLASRQLISMTIGVSDSQPQTESQPHPTASSGLRTIAELSRDHKWKAEAVKP